MLTFSFFSKNRLLAWIISSRTENYSVAFIRRGFRWGRLWTYYESFLSVVLPFICMAPCLRLLIAVTYHSFCIDIWFHFVIHSQATILKLLFKDAKMDGLIWIKQQDLISSQSNIAAQLPIKDPTLPLCVCSTHWFRMHTDWPEQGLALAKSARPGSKSIRKLYQRPYLMICKLDLSFARVL